MTHVLNALVHRDYAIEDAKCQLVVTPDTITVKSPGKPVEPITLEQMQSFDAPMLSRNPVMSSPEWNWPKNGGWG